MKNIVYTVREQGVKEDDHCTICVVDDLNKVDQLLYEYYGNLKEISYHDIRDSGIEYTKILEVLDHKGNPYKVTIIVELFVLNEI